MRKFGRMFVNRLLFCINYGVNLNLRQELVKERKENTENVSSTACCS